MKNSPQIALIALMIVLGACGKSKDGHTPDASKAAVAVVDAKSGDAAKSLEQLAAQKVEVIKDVSRLEAEIMEAQKLPNNEAKIAALQSSIDSREAELKTLEAKAASLKSDLLALSAEKAKILNEQGLEDTTDATDSDRMSIASTVSLAKNGFHRDESLFIKVSSDKMIVLGVQAGDLAAAEISATPSTEAKELAPTILSLTSPKGKGTVLALLDAKLSAKAGEIQVIAATEIPMADGSGMARTLELIRLDAKLSLIDRKVISKGNEALNVTDKGALVLADDTIVWAEQGNLHVFDMTAKTMKSCAIPFTADAKYAKYSKEQSELYRSGKPGQIMITRLLDGSQSLPLAQQALVITIDTKKANAKNPCGLQVQTQTDFDSLQTDDYNRVQDGYLYRSDIDFIGGSHVARIDATGKANAISSASFKGVAIVGETILGIGQDDHLKVMDASLTERDSTWSTDLSVDSVIALDAKAGTALAIARDGKAYLVDTKADQVLGTKRIRSVKTTETESLMIRASGLRFGEKSDLVPLLVYPFLSGQAAEGQPAFKQGLGKVIFVKIAQ